MERKNFAPGALTAPLPPALVTVGEGEEENVLTVAWTGILSSTPPRTYISVRPSRHSYALLRKYKEFVLHLPTDMMARTVDFCGIYTGAKVNKFEKCGLTKVKSAVVGAPTIAECPIAIECRVTQVAESGSHDIFFADIVNISCDGAILDENGKIRYDKAHLCAYAHGEYYTMGKKIGSFGFSAAKKRKMPSEKRTSSLTSENRTSSPAKGKKDHTKSQGDRGTSPKAVKTTKAQPAGGQKSAVFVTGKPKTARSSQKKGERRGRS